jgi:alanine racemase
MTVLRPTYAQINLENLIFNLRSSREFIGREVRYMAVVKADAYGHGAIECSRALEEEGVDWFGVALVEEAVELREAGITKPILCLGGFFPGQETLLFDNSITPVVFDLEQAKILDEAAQRYQKTIAIHIKIDTGMGRLGVWWDEAANFAGTLKNLANLELEGLMTHFASADNPADNDFTNSQIDRFYKAVDIFRSVGYSPRLIDLANSPGAVGHPQSRGDMVRLGGILYGLGGDVLPPGIPKPELRPVMSLHSTIAQLKRVPKGETLGYGRTFTTRRDSIIASIPIGYHDGYRRGLSNKARVIINGTSAPVVGRISMDWTIVDVTDVPKTRIGDQVILIGSDGDHAIAAEDLARILDTISYEITCGVNKRVRRHYAHY